MVICKENERLISKEGERGKKADRESMGTDSCVI